jgi:AbrB family looped-hinge helix DNA binding protein
MYISVAVIVGNMSFDFYSKVDDRFRITIEKNIRELAEIKPGDRVKVTIEKVRLDK